MTKSANQIMIDLGIDNDYWKKNVRNQTYQDPTLGQVTTVSVKGLRKHVGGGHEEDIAGTGKTNQQAVNNFDKEVEAAYQSQSLRFSKTVMMAPAAVRPPTTTGTTAQGQTPNP